MSEEDSGLPEEAAGKLDQSNAVTVDTNGPWRNSENMWTFQNFADLEEYGSEIVRGKAGSSATVVLVIDNEDADIPMYEKNKHYWILENADYGNNSKQLYIRHSVEYFSILVEEGSATMEQVNDDSQVEFLGAGRIKVSTFQGYPLYIRDSAIDDSRPETQTSSTTGATTGTTIETTTTAKPGAAGVVTESKTISAEVGLDAFGGAGDSVTQSSVTGGRGNGAAEVAQRRANSAVASKTAASVATGTDPCLPNNPPASTGAAGSGSTAPAGVPYPDAILRQARAAAAAPASVITNPLEAFGGAGAAITSAVTGGRGNGAAEVARRRADATAPTTVTQPPSTPTSSSTANPRPPNVYIYEPITPGFDRYDFNTGKKVYTPNGGPSRNNSGQTVTPPQSPTTMSSAASAEAAGFGSSQYGEFGPPVTARDPRQTGPF